MDIGNRIKELRTKKGLTQKELSEKCGLSKNGLWNYENNKRTPSIETLTNIAMALNVSLSTLLETETTFTNKVINLYDNTICKNCDAENTLELICELVDIDLNTLTLSIKNNEDISDLYLSEMLKQIYKEYPNEFIDFIKENYNVMLDKHLICFNACKEIINKKNVDEALEKALNLAQEGQKVSESWRNAVIKIESDPKYLLYTIMNYLENTESYFSYFFVDVLNNKDPNIPYLTDEQIKDIVNKVTELVKYELYKLEPK